MSKRALLGVVGLLALILSPCEGAFAQTSGLWGGKVIARYTFEPGEEVKWRGMGKGEGWYSGITTDPEEVISGKGSLKMVMERPHWRPLFMTLPEACPLVRNRAYLVSFKYRVLKADKGTHFRFSSFPRFGVDPATAERGLNQWWCKRKEGEAHFLVLLGNNDYYRFYLMIVGKGSIVVDDFVVREAVAEPKDLPAPKLLFPKEGAVLSPEGLQFAWTPSPPALEYELEISRRRDFKEGRRFLCRLYEGSGRSLRTLEMGGKEVRHNFGYCTLFLPSNLGRGRWFWRARVKGGKWSEARSFVLEPHPAQPLPSSLRPSPEKPLLLLHWTFHRPYAHISQCWEAVPEGLKPFVGFRFSVGLDPWLWNSPVFPTLEEFERAGARAFIQLPQNHIGVIPTSLLEEMFQRFPRMGGCVLVEYKRNPMDTAPEWIARRKEYVARVAGLCRRYGKLFVWFDFSAVCHTWLEVGGDRRLLEALRKNSENVVLGWKQNTPRASFLVQSAVMGLWLAGICGNWGINMEDFYWGEARFGHWEEMPAPFMGIMMLLGASGGATVYCVEHPHPFRGSQFSPFMREVVLPLFERLVKWKLIPSKEQVLASTRLAYHACLEDAEFCSPFHGGLGRRMFAENERLKMLFEGAYGEMIHHDHMIPKRPIPFFVPVLPSALARDELPQFKLILGPWDVGSREFVERAIRDICSEAEVAKGNAFCLRMGEKIFACNPWENWDRPSWFEVPLDNPFLSLRAELPVHSWLVGRQKGGEFLLHLNGRPERKARLTVRAEGRLKVFSQPEEAAKVEAEGVGRAVIIVNHALGLCDLVLRVGG